MIDGSFDFLMQERVREAVALLPVTDAGGIDVARTKPYHEPTQKKRVGAGGARARSGGRPGKRARKQAAAAHVSDDSSGSSDTSIAEDDEELHYQAKIAEEIEKRVQAAGGTPSEQAALRDQLSKSTLGAEDVALVWNGARLVHHGSNVPAIVFPQHVTVIDRLAPRLPLPSPTEMGVL